MRTFRTAAMPDMTFVIDVGFTMQRPIVPDEFTRRVAVAAFDENDACLAAAQIVSCDVEMVTSTTIVDFWI